MNNVVDLYNQTKEPFVVLFNQSVEMLPGILWALFMLFCGLLFSRIVSTGTKRILNAIKLDQYTEKFKVNEVFARIGLGNSPTYVLAFILSWAVMIIFIIFAADALHLDIVRVILQKFLLFVPKLIACVIVLFAGALFGRFIERLVLNSAKANKIRGGVFIAKIANVVVLVFTVLLALQQINIYLELIQQVIIIILASLGLAFGLALGLGGKAVVEDYLRQMVKENDSEEKEEKK